ncbi:hypothetical protein P8452_68400 [Trifolium repens]|nr:hypothetical protein P8452_68400 [Trifolium repens]
MERKILVSMCFFLIVLLTVQEAAVQTEARCEKESRLFFLQCFGSSSNRKCDSICRRREHSLSGFCHNQKCICCFC